MPASVRTGAKTLAELLPGNTAAQAADVAVSGICLDSRRCGRGDLFLAVQGRSHDGRRHIGAAIAAGCAAVVAEADDFDAVCGAITEGQRVPVISVLNLDQQLSAIAARFYGEPSARLRITAITGTNGKTTCSYLLGQLLSLLGTSTGIIGTLGYAVVDSGHREFTVTGMTTPDAVETQRILADFADQGVAAVTMEVSSHSLDQHRVAALAFDTAIFTNLSRDHLDYHGSLEAYGDAKARLFSWPHLGVAIINRDDAFGAQLLLNLPAHIKGVSYGLASAADGSGADVSASNIVYSPGGISALITTPWGEGQLHSPLLGEFNLANLMAVIAAACAQGHDLAAVLALAPKLQPVSGRMEQVNVANAPQVVVDYAHTPDALAKALEAVRRHCTGKLWCVFGCGGDRDAGKRPQMGAIAAHQADQVVVTSDNPRSEDPQAIIADILAGIADPQTVRVESDRRAAIRLAIATASSGDTVLIAGKGHEDYQLIGGLSLPFSDVAEARLALRDKARAGEGAR